MGGKAVTISTAFIPILRNMGFRQPVRPFFSPSGNGRCVPPRSGQPVCGVTAAGPRRTGGFIPGSRKPVGIISTGTTRGMLHFRNRRSSPAAAGPVHAPSNFPELTYRESRVKSSVSSEPLVSYCLPHFPMVSLTFASRFGMSSCCGHLGRHSPQPVHEDAGSPRCTGDIETV